MAAPRSALTDFLASLVAVPPRDLLKRGTEGRVVTSLARSAQAAGLAEAAAFPDDRLALHTLFNLALDGGLACWVADYVELVCCDRSLTSDDPTECYLLGGDCVLKWAQAALSRANNQLRDVLRAPAQFAQLHLNSAWLQGSLCRVNGLLLVLKALEREAKLDAAPVHAALPPSAGQASAAGAQPQRAVEVEDELRKASLVQSALQALDWLVRQRLNDKRPHGRFASGVDWARAFEERRRAAAADGLGPLFLEDLLAPLALDKPYPFASLQDAVAALFLGGAPGEAARGHKARALLYLLLDGEWPTDVDGFAAAFGLPPAAGRQLQALLLLDAARTEPTQRARLPQACELLASCADAGVPFKALQVLQALGCPEVAAAVRQAQGGGDSQRTTLQQAEALVRIQLDLGLLPDAFAQLREHCAAAPPAELAAHQAALMTLMADWALAQTAQQQRQAGGGVGSSGAGFRETGTLDMTPRARQARAAGADGDAGAGAGAAGAAPASNLLQQLLQLPLSQGEERALLQWLMRQATTRLDMAHQLPLYFLQRGRPAEALAAAQQLRLTDRLSSAGAGSDAAALLRELLTAAARALPSGLRGATLHTPDGAAVGLCQGLDVPPCMEAPTAHLRLSGAPGVAGALPPFFDCWWGVRRAAEAAGGEEVATLAQGAAAAPVAARPLDVVMADGDGAAAAPLPGSRFPQAPPAGFLALPAEEEAQRDGPAAVLRPGMTTAEFELAVLGKAPGRAATRHATKKPRLAPLGYGPW